MGILKAVYQIAFGTDPDKHFRQNIQFWGLSVSLALTIIALLTPTLQSSIERRHHRCLCTNLAAFV